MARSKRYRLHPLAWEEIDDADNWYRQRNVEASNDFVAEVFDAIKSIRLAPRRWPEYIYKTRRFVLDRFPYAIIYLDTPELVDIVAVAHSKRKPGYWKRRLQT